MIDLGDRRRLITELLIAELLARPGEPGPLARPRWRPVVSPPPPRDPPAPPDPERR